MYVRRLSVFCSALDGVADGSDVRACCASEGGGGVWFVELVLDGEDCAFTVSVNGDGCGDRDRV